MLVIGLRRLPARPFGGDDARINTLSFTKLRTRMRGARTVAELDSAAGGLVRARASRRSGRPGVLGVDPGACQPVARDGTVRPALGSPDHGGARGARGRGPGPDARGP